MMKKCLLLLVALTGSLVAAAQDLIVKIDSTRIEARVDEISTEQIRYKRFARPDGPTYVVPVAQVCYIRYADGFVENYNRAAAPAPTTVSVVAPTPAPAPAPAPAPQPVQQPAPASVSQPVQQSVPAPAPAPAPQPAPVVYAQAAPAGQQVEHFDLGQLYDRNGVRGIVVALNEDRTHGLVMSIDQEMLAWSVFRKGNYRLIGANDKMDGAKNMAIVEAYIARENLSWDDFPAFKWCRDKGEGWYLPSVDELLTIGNNYNGGSRQRNDRATRSRWNDNLRLAGGVRLDMKRLFHSSTELNESLAMMAVMGIEVPFLYNMSPDTSDPVQKYTTFLVRAVHKF